VGSSYNRCHNAILEQFHLEYLTHPPYNLDLASNNFHLTGPLKENSEGERFQHDEVKAEVHQWEQTLSPDFFYTGIKWVVYDRDNRSNHAGYYM
jgi:hypothetical protein